MAISVTPNPTHAVGDALPVADWNAAATWLNAGIGWVASNGLVTTLSTNNSGTTGPGTGPFMVFAGSWNITSATGTGLTGVTIPNGGFPNGIIAAIAIPFTKNASGASQANHSMQVSAANTTKSVVYFIPYNSSGTVVDNTPISFSAFIIGY